MFCPKCGAEVRDDDMFCQKCGTTLKGSTSQAVPVRESQELGIDIVSKDRSLQDYWISRAIAFGIDSVIIGAIVLVLSFIFQFPDIIAGRAPLSLQNPFDIWFPFSTGLLSVLYFSLYEYSYKETFGKRIMGFRVETISGKPIRLDDSFIRNLSKLFWPLILLDILGGLMTSGAPKQKYSDRVVGAIVKSGKTYSFVRGRVG